MRLALDSNRYTDLCRGDSAVAHVLEQAERIYLPFAVLAEVKAGFACGSRRSENERVLRQFLQKPGVEALFPSEATVRVYAGLYRQLRQQGTPIPVNDLWIAALVVEHSLVLCSRDQHFRHLPQLEIV